MLNVSRDFVWKVTKVHPRTQTPACLCLCVCGCMCTALNGITYKKRILPSRWPNKKDHNLFARNFQAQPASKRFRARPDAMPNATKNRAMTGEPQLEKEGAREIERYTPIYHTLKLEISLTTTSLGATSGHDGVGSDAWSSLLAVFFSLFLFLACFDCLPREWSSTLQAMQIWSGGSGSSFSKCLLFPSTKSMRYVSTTSRRPIGLAL